METIGRVDGAPHPASDDGPTGSNDPEVRRSWRGFVAIGSVLVPALGLGILAWWRRWTSDDGFIFYRVVDQVVHGNGPVFNAGERVEAATSTLWVGILSFARLLAPNGIALEEIGLWLALLLSVFGVTAAGFAALRIARATSRHDPDPIIVPFGALVVVAVTAFWDFSTSGLEMGLAFAWIGGCFWALVAYTQTNASQRKTTRYLLAVLLGLGPLVRPDLLLMSLCFLVGLLVADAEAGWGRRISMIAVAAVLPVAYEIFRMGYYGVLIPTPAIAKGASSSDWDRGIDYLSNLNVSYSLWFAALLVAAAIAVTAVHIWRGGEHRLAAMVVVPVAAAALHGFYIVKVGGDFMHARLLLPALFAFVTPVAVVVVRRVWVAVGVGALAVWALVCGSFWRPQNAAVAGDQRGFYVQQTQNANPVTLEDWRKMPWVKELRSAQRKMEGGRRLLVVPGVGTFYQGKNGDRIFDVARTLPLAKGIPQKGVYAFTAIGAVGFAAGEDLFVADRLGLADPVAARIGGQPSYFPTGHRRYMSIPWVEARFAAPDAKEPDSLRAAAAAQGREALRCGDLGRLMGDVRDPLTVGGFLGNIGDSVPNTLLTIPDNPFKARAKFCGGATP